VSRQLALCGYWEDVQWFCLNFVAVAVERIVLSACRRLLSKNVIQHTGWKFAGHARVFAYMFWFLPKPHYSKIYSVATEVSLILQPTDYEVKVHFGHEQAPSDHRN
jgi:hypothetical protein